MMHNLAFLRGKPALAVLALFLTQTIVQAGDWFPYPFRGSNAFGTGVYAPSYYGYPLDEDSPGYYGGSRYREYQTYGRAGFTNFADYPGPVPGPGLPPDYRGPMKKPCASNWDIPPAPKPVASPLLQGATVAHIAVEAPADAEIWIDGHPTKQSGANRSFVTPPLTRGESYAYEIKARWMENGKPVEQKEQVTIEAGDEQTIHFPTGGAKGLLPDPKPFPLPAGE